MRIRKLLIFSSVNWKDLNNLMFFIEYNKIKGGVEWEK